MANDDYILLDTKSFDAFLENKERFISLYDSINNEYDRIVSSLMTNWKGRGADAFKKDTETVKKNIVGIFDMLKTMCDTLTDCENIFAKCDRALGEYNRQQ